jgi:uncharacterized membrane protein SpoIIM required for sporulation
MSEAELEGMEEMYKNASPDLRNANTNATMTGFYIWNNVGIAFRCFATGVLFGLGSMFFVLFNALKLGVVLGHLARTGLGENIFSFISAHSPWELTAVVLSGAAGMQMGFALALTHGRTRIGNLEAHGLELLRQIAGTALFLGIAAMLEAWLSPSALPSDTKYLIGVVGWISVALWLGLSGRDRPIPADVLALRAEGT